MISLRVCLNKINTLVRVCLWSIIKYNNTSSMSLEMKKVLIYVECIDNFVSPSSKKQINNDFFFDSNISSKTTVLPSYFSKG